MNDEEKTVKVTGINRTASGKYQARIFADGKQKYLGSFETYKEAVNARLEAENKYGKPSSRKIHHEIIGKTYPNSHLFVDSWGISNFRRQTIYHCTCECGNKIDVSYSQLKSGKIKSCGCVSAESTDKMVGVFLQDDGKYLASIGVNNENIILGRFETFEESKKARLDAEEKYGTPTNRKIHYDIIGKRYPDTLLYIDNWSINEKNLTIYHCTCECGNKTTATYYQLSSKHKRSCGCLIPDTAREVLADDEGPQQKIIKLSRFNEGSALGMQRKLSVNNKSTVKGVQKRKNSYVAYINISKKQTYLGSFPTLAEAARVRKEAEEKYYKPVIDKFNNRLKKHGKTLKRDQNKKA